MQQFILLLCIFFVQQVKAQELFVYTEPASNMPAKSIGIRMNNYLMDDLHSKKTNYHLVPELMWGVSRNLMIHVEGFLSKRDKNFVAEGGGVYAKYRVYSTDGIQNHFRLAVYGRYSFNNSNIHQNAIDLYGHNTGYEAGIIGTKLIKKVAFSASASFLHAQDNGSQKFHYGDKSRNAVNYTLSVGKLMLPKTYSSYNQTNLNLMLEFLGQTNVGSGYSYFDMAPSVQLIFLSRMRFDAGYRFALYNELSLSLIHI